MGVSYVSSAWSGSSNGGDSPSYNVGDTMTLTFNYQSTDFTGTPASTTSYSIEVTTTDSVGTGVITGAEGAPSFSVTTPEVPGSADPITSITASNTPDPSRVWDTVSNTMTLFDPDTGVSQWTAVFTATA